MTSRDDHFREKYEEARRVWYHTPAREHVLCLDETRNEQSTPWHLFGSYKKTRPPGQRIARRTRPLVPTRRGPLGSPPDVSFRRRRTGRASCSEWAEGVPLRAGTGSRRPRARATAGASTSSSRSPRSGRALSRPSRSLAEACSPPERDRKSTRLNSSH